MTKKFTAHVSCLLIKDTDFFKKSKAPIDFDVEVEFDHEPTYNEIENALRAKSKELFGIMPYEEIDHETGSCAVTIISPADEDNVVIEQSVEEAEEMSTVSAGLVYRGYPDPDKSDFVDFKPSAD